MQRESLKISYRYGIFQYFIFFLLLLRSLSVEALRSPAHQKLTEDCPDYEIKTSSTTPSVFLVETNKNKNKELANCITRVSEGANHTVYFGGRASGQSFPCSKEKIPPSFYRICVGWDTAQGMKSLSKPLLSSKPFMMLIYIDDLIKKEEKLNNKEFQNYLKKSLLILQQMNPMIKKIQDNTRLPQLLKNQYVEKLISISGGINKEATISLCEKILEIKKNNPNPSFKEILKALKQKLSKASMDSTIADSALSGFRNSLPRTMKQLTHTIGALPNNGNMAFFIVPKAYITKKVREAVGEKTGSAILTLKAPNDKRSEKNAATKVRHDF